MLLPRRLCSLLGGFLLLFLCFFYVLDRYNYQYDPHLAVVGPEYPVGGTGQERPWPRSLALTRPLLNATSRVTRHPNATAPPEDRRRVPCKKKYWRCNNTVPTNPEPPPEVLQELEAVGGSDPSSSPMLEAAPLWTQYADRGYTVLGRNETAVRRLPHVLIIGAKKSGTRALLAFLRVHPSIRASGPEVHYFDRYYSKGLDWYRSKLPLSLEGQLTVEKTPAYFTTPGVPARVRMDLPACRLLLVVRDPVTRALSDYTQSLSKHRARRPFEDMAFVSSSPGLVNSEWGPISGGLYARHLQRWLDHFPRSSIHVVSGENLIKDPAAELCRVQEFLGLRRVITEKHFFFNVTKGFPCLVKREKSGRPHCLGSSKGRSHPEVSHETYNTLRDFYRPFNYKFYKMVGQNFRW